MLTANSSKVKCDSWITSGLMKWDVSKEDPGWEGNLVASEPVRLEAVAANWTVLAYKKQKRIKSVAPPYTANATKHMVCMEPLQMSGKRTCCTASVLQYKAKTPAWLPTKRHLYAQLRLL